MQTLKKVIGLSLQQQLAHFKQHVYSQFVKINHRLDRVDYRNVVDYAKRNDSAHAKGFEKAFPLLPCKTLKKLKPLKPFLAARS
jgi:hypothetical protein